MCVVLTVKAASDLTVGGLNPVGSIPKTKVRCFSLLGFEMLPVKTTKSLIILTRKVSTKLALGVPDCNVVIGTAVNGLLRLKVGLFKIMPSRWWHSNQRSLVPAACSISGPNLWWR